MGRAVLDDSLDGPRERGAAPEERRTQENPPSRRPSDRRDRRSSEAQTPASARSLAQESAMLKTEVTKFLDTVRAA